jgi:hypothetical protein
MRSEVNNRTDLVAIIDQSAGISVSQRHYHSMLQLPSSQLLIRQTFPLSERRRYTLAFSGRLRKSTSSHANRYLTPDAFPL